MHLVHNGTSPKYLTDITTSISSMLGHRCIRSAMTTEYDIPRTRIKFGDRAFSLAGPSEGNALPADIRNIADMSSIKRAIKTLFYIDIIGSNSFTFSDCTMFGASGQFLEGGGCKMRHINEFYLLTYLLCFKFVKYSDEFIKFSCVSKWNENLNFYAVNSLVYDAFQLSV